MSAQWKWVIGIGSIVVIFALLACGIFLGWRYFFPEKPSVEIAAPPSNYETVEGDEVTVEARATGRSIVRVELWVDDGLVDSASSPSPQDAFSAALTWPASGVGPHTVEVRAYDGRGQASEPAAIVLIVATGVAEATPTATEEVPSETPTPTTSPTATATSPPGATATPTSPPTATPTETPTPEPTDTPAPTATPCPAVADFWADPDTVEVNVTFKLKWHVECVSAIYLSGPGVGDHVAVTGPDGEKELSRADPGDYDYTLHVEAPSGDFDKNVTVTVIPAGPTEVTVRVRFSEVHWADIPEYKCPGGVCNTFLRVYVNGLPMKELPGAYPDSYFTGVTDAHTSFFNWETDPFTMNSDQPLEIEVRGLINREHYSDPYGPYAPYWIDRATVTWDPVTAGEGDHSLESNGEFEGRFRINLVRVTID